MPRFIKQISYNGCFPTSIINIHKCFDSDISEKNRKVLIKQSGCGKQQGTSYKKIKSLERKWLGKYTLHWRNNFTITDIRNWIKSGGVVHLLYGWTETQGHSCLISNVDDKYFYVINHFTWPGTNKPRKTVSRLDIKAMKRLMKFRTMYNNITGSCCFIRKG